MLMLMENGMESAGILRRYVKLALPLLAANVGSGP